MANKQTRRSISVNREVYEKCKAAAAAANIPLSQFTEQSLLHRVNLDYELKRCGLPGIA